MSTTWPAARDRILQELADARLHTALTGDLA